MDEERQNTLYCNPGNFLGRTLPVRHPESTGDQVQDATPDILQHMYQLCDCFQVELQSLAGVLT